MTAPRRRRLSDLYVRGRMLEPNDGEGEPIKIWLAKLNEIDRSSAVLRANAAKARFMVDADNEDSETFQAAYSEVRAFDDRNELVTFIIAEDGMKARRRIESEIASDEESWGKDDYLQGLVDAWAGDDDNPGLASVIVEDPNDPEAQRVKAELDRFEGQVQKALEQELDRLTKEWDDVEIDVIRRKATHRLLEVRAADAFRRELNRQQLFFSVRDPVHRQMRYFENVKEIDDLDDDLRNWLVEQYETMTVDAWEGKASPPVPDSSTSSAELEVVESSPSGPAAVTG